MRKPIILSLIFCVAACGGGEEKRERPTPLVTIDAASAHQFSDIYVAVGTANANEQVSVRAPVTERITQLGLVPMVVNSPRGTAKKSLPSPL